MHAQPLNDIQQRFFLIASDDPHPFEEHLCGLAFSRSELIVGAAGLKQYRTLYPNDGLLADRLDEGRFSAILRDDSGYTIKTDSMAQDSVFYFDSDTLWIVSNSLLALCRELKKRGIAIRLDIAATCSFLVGNQSLFGGQLLSHRTPVEAVRILPLGSELKIRRKGSSWRLQLCPHTTHESYPYHETLVRYLTNTQSRILALHECGFSFVVDLSGGYDSRICFGIMAHSGVPRDKISISTRAGDQYNIATTISHVFGYRHEQFQAEDITARPDLAYEAWKLGCLGIYLPVYPVATEHTGSVRVHGGSFRARSYITKSARGRLNMFLPSIPAQYHTSFGEMFLEAFQEINISPESPWAMAEHYNNFRSRLHYGLNSYKSVGIALFTPLLSRELQSASNALGWHSYQKPQLEYDLMSIIDKRLLDFRFDRAEKAFSLNMLEKSPFYQRTINPFLNPVKLDVYGRFSPEARAVTSMAKDPRREARDQFRRLLLDDYYRLSPRVRGLDMPMWIFEKAEQEMPTSYDLEKSVKNISLIVALGTILELS